MDPTEKRKLEMVLDSCSKCPYFKYNSRYGRSYDSGYDCQLTSKRIINDFEIDVNKTFPIEIPEWCPLPKT